MAYTVNWLTKVISIPKADLVLISGTLYELDTEVFRNNLHTIQASEAGIVNDDIFQRNAPYTVAGITYAQSIEIINGYSITFEDGAYSVRLVGSNNNIFDIESGILNQNQVQVIPNNSAGLVDINKEDIEHGAYDGGVTFDFLTGGSGTTHPWGTNRPNLAAGGTYGVNNLSDGLAIATARGFRRIYIKKNWTFGASDNIDQLEVIGDSPSRTLLTFTPGCSTSQTEFFSAELTGTLDGALSMTSCHIEDLSGVGGNASETNIHKCLFEPDAGATMKLTAGATRGINIIDCESGSTGDTPIIIDMNGTGPSMTVRRWAGGMKIINATNGQEVSFDGDGHLTIDSTCTNLTAVVRGDTKITDNRVTKTPAVVDQTSAALTGALVQISRLLTKEEFIALS